jgi:hypothetical protein
MTASWYQDRHGRAIMCRDLIWCRRVSQYATEMSAHRAFEVFNLIVVKEL